MDPAALGFVVTGFTTIEVTQGRFSEVVDRLVAIPQVIEVHTVAGVGDLLCRVVARSNEGIMEIVELILQIPGVDRTRTALALAHPIHARPLPLVWLGGHRLISRAIAPYLVSERVAGSLPSVMTDPDSRVTELPSPAPPVGILLLNLGTPDSPKVSDVRRYLREFLSDPRVIDIHPIARRLLLELLILPFRPAKSARAYKLIWTGDGSPCCITASGSPRACAARWAPNTWSSWACATDRPRSPRPWPGWWRRSPAGSSCCRCSRNIPRPPPARPSSGSTTSWGTAGTCRR